MAGDTRKNIKGAKAPGDRGAHGGSGEFFEGWSASREMRRSSDNKCTKRDEPQDRQRDATSPRAVARRKPSRWCETTRTEHDFGIGIPEPKDEKLASHPGVDAHGDLARGVPQGMVDGGAEGRRCRCKPVAFVQPQERSPA